MSQRKSVEIFMGSDSDLDVMKDTAKQLEAFGIDFGMYILSAHRCGEEVLELARSAASEGVEVIIAGAGKAAHLPGVIAGATYLPVIGIPMKTSDLGGLDSLYSIVQMPAGVPVATVAIGQTGAKNAAILAAQILGVKYPEIQNKVKEYKEKMRFDVLTKNKRLQETGYETY